MAVLGMTKLEAVNLMLEAIDEEPVAALDTGGTSIQGKAERILDRTSEIVQARGWPENTMTSKQHTASGGSVTVGSDVLWIRAAGPDQHKPLVLKGDKVWDRAADALYNANVYLDIIRELAFEDCSPKLKHTIATEASAILQRRQKGEAVNDQFLQQEALIANVGADRLKPADQWPNVAPLVPQQPAQ